MSELVTIENGRAITTSRSIAEMFEKQHYNVIRDIRSVMRDAGGGFSPLNFEERNYTHRGKQYPMYQITRDGFALLVMGYTGPKAMRFKVEYINAFNRMEAALHGAPPPQPDITPILAQLTHLLERLGAPQQPSITSIGQYTPAPEPPQPPKAAPTLKVRMRTRDECMAMLKQEDPGTYMTKGALSGLIQDKRITYVKVGRKYLINYDRLIDYLNAEGSGMEPPPVETADVSPIRRIKV